MISMLRRRSDAADVVPLAVAVDLADEHRRPRSPASSGRHPLLGIEELRRIDVVAGRQRFEDAGHRVRQPHHLVDRDRAELGLQRAVDLDGRALRRPSGARRIDRRPLRARATRTCRCTPARPERASVNRTLVTSPIAWADAREDRRRLGWQRIALGLVGPSASASARPITAAPNSNARRAVRCRIAGLIASLSSSRCRRDAEPGQTLIPRSHRR